MRNQLIGILILTFGLLHHSCKKTTVEPTTPINQISNSSFEVDDKPSLVGWSPSDTTDFIKFSNDVPQNGGNWSVRIETVWGPPPRIRATLQPSEGTHRYQLSTWSKKQGIGGTIYVFLNSTLRKSVVVSDTVWNVYTIIDTISASSADSISIQLAGGFSQILAGKTYYDLCTFQKLD